MSESVTVSVHVLVFVLVLVFVTASVDVSVSVSVARVLVAKYGNRMYTCDSSSSAMLVASIHAH